MDSVIIERRYTPTHDTVYITIRMCKYYEEQIIFPRAHEDTIFCNLNQCLQIDSNRTLRGKINKFKKKI